MKICSGAFACLLTAFVVVQAQAQTPDAPPDLQPSEPASYSLAQRRAFRDTRTGRSPVPNRRLPSGNGRKPGLHCQAHQC